MPPPANLTELLATEIYPGIDPFESKVIREFLRLYGYQFDRIEFDVKLGEGQAPPAGTPDVYAKMWSSLTRKRADVVCWAPGKRAVIVEAKWVFHLRDVGQLIGYGELFKKQYPDWTAALVAICVVVDGDVQSVLGKYGANLMRFDLPGDAVAAETAAANEP